MSRVPSVLVPVAVVQAVAEELTTHRDEALRRARRLTALIGALQSSREAEVVDDEPGPEADLPPPAEPPAEPPAANPEA